MTPRDSRDWTRAWNPGPGGSRAFGEAALVTALRPERIDALSVLFVNTIFVPAKMHRSCGGRMCNIIDTL
jgi:hypothetical protein